MADREVDHLLIGGGLASASCARTLREEGAEGSILLVGREPDPPYNRPPCSKGYLTGDESREETHYRSADWYREQSIELATGTSVMKLDPSQRTATLSSKETVAFGQALLATGANVRRLRVDGAQLEGIHYLRTLGNADAIRADTEGAQRVVLIGGSYIGTEVAASLTELGRSCTIVMMEPVTLAGGFGTQAGGFFQGVLEEHGVEVIGNDTLARFEGDGRVERVVTESGREVECDAVVMGTGVVPDVMLARSAGLELGESGGVRCSGDLRTSAEAVWAAGDMCEYESPIHGRSLRIEHWDVASAQGRTAALNMLGRGVAHDVVPYFFSDLSDWSSMEYVGPAYEWDEEVVRGSLEDGEFTIFYVHEGRVAGALTVGRGQDLDGARRLIVGGTDVAAALGALADPDTDLGELQV